MWNASAPVVVGIDGSDAAIHAAIWAIDEAISRDVPLRIVHVTHIDEQSAPEAGEFRLDVQYAETSLRAVVAAVEAVGRQVKIESEILWGAVDTALIAESANASMICLGSVGIGFLASEVLGSTAATLAENAYCPVAIIRTQYDTQANVGGCIAVVIEDRADNDSVIEYAMEEARLRKAPVLAVGVSQEDFGQEPDAGMDRRVEAWKRRYQDIDIVAVASQTSIATLLAAHKEYSPQLAVVGRTDALSVAQIIGPHGHALAPHAACSVLVVR